MQLVAVGLNHQTAPLSVRERLAFLPEALPEALHDLRRRKPVREAAILSTCNRTELYCATEAPQAAAEWLAERHALDAAQLTPYLYLLPQRDTVRHAFRVASGLDSMVLGETQILGQMKDAVRRAEEAGSLGSTLHKLFQRSFAVAKEVRSATAIGANVVSMAAAAVRLAERIFPSISGQNILFIGAGEMIGLAATHFAARAPRRIAVANRTVERAAQLAHQHNAAVLRLEEVGDVLHEYDIVVSCTASPLPIIGLGMVERAIRMRRHRPMFMVDLAVPRDIETEAGKLDDVFLYTVDDLQQVVATGVESRQAAVIEAEAIIDSSVESFLHWLGTRETVPLIRALRDSAEAARRQEIEHAMKLLSRGDEPGAVLEELSRRLTNKLMHAPTQALNQAADDERSMIAALVSRLYPHSSEN